MYIGWTIIYYYEDILIKLMYVYYIITKYLYLSYSSMYLLNLYTCYLIWKWNEIPIRYNWIYFEFNYDMLMNIIDNVF